MFSPKSLRADFKDYEPVISEEIMRLHYEQHYKGYLTNLNNALKKFPKFSKQELPDLLEMINELPVEIRDAVRNNGGGVINHEILWSTLSTKPSEIHSGTLKEEIEKKFGSWKEFIQEMVSASVSLFGSGWVWLAVNKHTKELSIVSTSNQDSPYMYERIPVFGIDVWEHAYYIQYKNVRKQYAESILKIMDWKEVEKRFLKIKQS